MWNPILPRPIDNRFRGLKPALWLFALITLMRVTLGLGHIFRSDGGAQSVSTIPLDTYPPGAAQNVIALVARMGLEQLLVGSILVVVLVRYRAMIPLMYALLVSEAVALEGIVRLKPLALAGTSGARPIHLALTALTVLGFVLSLLGKGHETGQRKGRRRASRRPSRNVSREDRMTDKSSGLNPLVTYRGAVYPSQCDHMGHMNVMWYVGKFDEATWQLFREIGLTPARLRAEPIGMAGVEQHIEYKHELFAGDVVTVTSTILEIRDKAIRFAHEMRNDETGVLAARMLVVAVHLDRTTRKARSFPDDVRERAQSLVAMGGVV